MNRREFLVRAGVFAAIPVVIQVVGCGDDDSSATAPPNTQFSFSASGSGHSHTGVMTCTQLNSGATVNITSSTTQGHNHSVVVSAAQLTTIMSGGTVTIQTSDSGHVHDWAISRPAGVCA